MILVRRGFLATIFAGTLALSGCLTLGGGSDDKPTPRPSAATTPPAGAEALATFYQQDLSWRTCMGGQCADLTVPLDYAEPDGDTIVVKVFRARATKQSRRIGSLVVNPGGPGGSGIDYARAADFIVGKPVRERYDIVGFDPRGVQRSEPIDCLSDDDLDTLLGGDPTPDDKAEEQAFAEGAKNFADACKTNAGPLLPHVSTEDVARDMDILRAALGETKLNYLGKSYGTYLGAVYAGMFPKLVGRFVLDGVLAPDLTSAEINAGQAEGFERATRAWAADCVSEGHCPVGDSVDAAMQGLRELLKGLDSLPVPISGNGDVTELTEGWASLGIGQAMYDQGQWSTLSNALRKLVNDNDGGPLMGLANSYAERNAEGGYSSNIMEVIYAVNCLDKPEVADLASFEAAAKRDAVKAPTWGPFLAWSSMPCGYWPIKTAQPPAKITAAGSGPIVVVGTTRDPATPYEWSVMLRKELANATLVTFDGDGHTAYMRSHSKCLDGSINDYYVDGTVPKDGLKC